MKSITYSIDGDAPATVDAAAVQVMIGAPADHSNDGVHTLSFYATDNDGNQETAQSVTVKIDTTPPMVSASGARQRRLAQPRRNDRPQRRRQSRRLRSGLDRLHPRRRAHTVAGASTRVVLPARPNATHTLTYRATDLAGNASADGASACTSTPSARPPPPSRPEAVEAKGDQARVAGEATT